LRDGQGIYHVAGKLGSGKSTLMKYLCQSPETLHHLSAWAGTKKLIMGSFFFWRPGTSLQKSTNGLMRGLLHCVTKQSAELAEELFPAQWAALQKEQSNPHFDQSDLQEAFNKLTKSRIIYERYRLAFFIDGLDEYDGDHAQLTGRLRTWVDAGGADFKLCASSREWLVFMAQFSRCPRLRLQDLTRLDIEQTVRGKLEGNHAFHILMQHKGNDFEQVDDTEDPKKRFINKIVNRSDGVFLWVKLVLRTIEQSLMMEDRLKDMEEKIDIMPTELEKLYEHIFNSIMTEAHPIDRKNSIGLIQIALHDRHKTLLQCSFLQDFRDDINFGLKLPIQSLDSYDTQTRRRRAEKQILAHCRGLLDISPFDGESGIYQMSFLSAVIQPSWLLYGSCAPKMEQKVSVIHRSVAEFLSRSDIQSHMSRYWSSNEVGRFLGQAYLATLKASPDINPRCFAGMLPYYVYITCLKKDVQSFTALQTADDKTGVKKSVLCEIWAQVADAASQRFEETRGAHVRSMSLFVWAHLHLTRSIHISTFVRQAMAIQGLEEYWELRPVPRGALHDHRLDNPHDVLLSLLIPLVFCYFQSPVLGFTSPLFCHKLLRSLVMGLDHGLGYDEGPWIVEKSKDKPNGVNWWVHTLKTLPTCFQGHGRRRMGPPILVHDMNPIYEPVIRLFLLYGAEPRAWFVFQKCGRPDTCDSMSKPLDDHAHLWVRWLDGHDDASWWGDGPKVFLENPIQRMLKAAAEESPPTIPSPFRSAKNELSFWEIIEFWFTPRRTKVLRRLMEINVARGRNPTPEEVQQLVADPELDLNVWEGITWDEARPLWKTDD